MQLRIISKLFVAGVICRSSSLIRKEFVSKLRHYSIAMTSAGNSIDELRSSLQTQADLVRKMKADKCDAESIAKAVVELKALKTSIATLENPDKVNGVEGTNSSSTTQLLKTPKGTRDYGAKEMAIREHAFNVITDVFKRHGGEQIDTPVFELKDLLMNKYGEDTKLIYELKDQGGEMLALRYDLTVPFARFLAQSKTATMKRYQIGKVYRRDQPSMTKGRYREFYQCDFDIAGNFDNMMADAECVKIVAEILTELEIADFVIKINHRGILEAIFLACGIKKSLFRCACSSVDKLDKLPWGDVKKELLEKGISEESANKLEDYVTLNGGLEVLDELEKMCKVKELRRPLDDMRLLYKYCTFMGCSNVVSIDMSLARGLDYYTGLIYEAVVLKLPDVLVENSGGNSDADNRVGVGSIAGGGRYDNLVSSLEKGSAPVPCVGVSIGVERVFTILEAQFATSKRRLGYVDVYICSAQKNLVEHRLKLSAELWRQQLLVETSLKKNPKLLDQLQACEKKQIPVAIILGGSEIESGQVTVRIVETRTERRVTNDAALGERLKKLADLLKINDTPNAAEQYLNEIAVPQPNVEEGVDSKEQ